MFGSRKASGFTYPSTQNSFMKSQRQYPSPKQAKQGKFQCFPKNNMSLQKSNEEIEVEEPKSPLTVLGGIKTTQQTQLSIIRHDDNVRRYSFLAQYPVSQTDETLLWELPLSSMVARKKTIVIRTGQYIISNWTGDQFPSVIYLHIDGFSGYLKGNSTVTSRVVALQLKEVNPVLDDAGQRTYDLRYVNDFQVAWTIPQQLTSIKLRMLFDEQTSFVPLPIVNPIVLTIQIRLEGGNSVPPQGSNGSGVKKG